MDLPSLPREPVLSMKSIDVAARVAAGVLEEITGRKMNRLFRCAGVVRIINREPAR